MNWYFKVLSVTESPKNVFTVHIKNGLFQRLMLQPAEEKITYVADMLSPGCGQNGYLGGLNIYIKPNGQKSGPFDSIAEIIDNWKRKQVFDRQVDTRIL